MIITSNDDQIPFFRRFGIDIKTNNGSQTETKFVTELTDEELTQVKAHEACFRATLLD